MSSAISNNPEKPPQSLDEREQVKNVLTKEPDVTTNHEGDDVEQVLEEACAQRTKSSHSSSEGGDDGSLDWVIKNFGFGDSMGGSIIDDL